MLVFCFDMNGMVGQGINIIMKMMMKMVVVVVCYRMRENEKEI